MELVICAQFDTWWSLRAVRPSEGTEPIRSMLTTYWPCVTVISRCVCQWLLWIFMIHSLVNCHSLALGIDSEWWLLWIKLSLW